jgi:hypothetical protein
MSPYYINQNPNYAYNTDTQVTDIRIGNSTSTASGYNNYYDYPTRKKQETIKERHIREGSAFKCFYGKGSYTPINKNIISKAEHKEKAERVNKFKGLNENLIIK